MATVYDRLKLGVKHPQTFAGHNRNEIVRLRAVSMDLETKISEMIEILMQIAEK